MSTQTTELLLLEDLEERGRVPDLPEGDRAALDAVAEWIKAFILEPNDELGRSGPVCPYMPTSVARQRMWLAAERIGDGHATDVIEVINSYKRRLLDVTSSNGGDTNYDVITVVFTDLSASRAQTLFDEVLGEIAATSYAEDGIVFGPFYNGNAGTAIYNKGFRPFQSPVPFIFVRHGVVGDWKFFVDKEDWLKLWGRRFGEQGVKALAAELRRLPWDARRD